MGFDYETFRAGFRAAAARRGINPVVGATVAQAAEIARELAITFGSNGSAAPRLPIGDVLEDVRKRVHRPTEEAAIAAVMRNVPRQGDKLPITLETLRELYPEVMRELKRPAVKPLVVLTPGIVDGGRAGKSKPAPVSARAARAPARAAAAMR